MQDVMELVQVQHVQTLVQKEHGVHQAKKVVQIVHLHILILLQLVQRQEHNVENLIHVL